MAYGIAILTASTEWSTLDMSAVMGVGHGEPDLGAHRIIIENAGRAAEIPGMVVARDNLPVYALASEIDEWY
jgi:hypothetical protein